MTQKFFQGDLVRITKDMPQSMAHFPCDQEAIVLYSYSERYDRGSSRNDTQLGLYLLKDKAECAWYDDDQLELIEADRYDLLPSSHILHRNWVAKTKRDLERL